MKSTIPILIIAILLTACINEDQKGSVRVMSLNVRYDNPDDGINRWDNRKDLVVSTLIEESPDLLGMQEVLHSQLVELDTLLPWYDYIGVGRDDGKTGGEFVPIFYKMNRLDLKDHGTFWLSDTPDSVGSVGWDAALPRTVTWARFYDKHRQKEFFALNTHLDHRGIRAKDYSTALIEAFISKNSGGLPVVLTGDFNFQFRNKNYKYLTREGGIFRDTHADTTMSYSHQIQSFNGFKFEKGKSRIDFIFVTHEWKIYEPEILPVVEEGLYISDHFPVVVNVKL